MRGRRPGPVADARALTGAFAEVFGARTTAAWVPVLAAAGMPCAPVQDLAAVQHDPKVVATGLLQRVAHPAGEVTVVGSSCPTG